MLTAPVLVAVALAALVVGAFLAAALSGRVTGLSRYAKTAVSTAGGVAVWVVATFPTDPRVQRYGVPVVALLTALGVYAVPNRPPAGEVADAGMSEQDLTATEE